MSVAVEGLAVLLLISVCVRLIPSFIGTRIRIPQRVIDIISIAVFVNMFVYCFVSEASKQLMPTMLAFIFLLLLTRFNLLLNIAVSSVVFVVSAHFLHVVS